MKHAELIELVTQLRRQTRNTVLLTVLDEAERLANIVNKGGAEKKDGKKRDRKEYMAQYMREYRKKKK